MAQSLASMLDGYLAQVDAQPGAWCWSRNNCVHFAGRWVELATGRKVLGSLADVADVRAARHMLARLGGGTLKAAVTQAMGHASLPAKLAQVGDVVLMPGLSAAAAKSAGLLGCGLGICIGRHATCLDAHGHRVSVAMSLALAAWPLFPRENAMAAAA